MAAARTAAGLPVAGPDAGRDEDSLPGARGAVVEGVPVLLCGSIRDDGPLPDVITDAVMAQDAMRVRSESARLVRMIGTRAPMTTPAASAPEKAQ